MRGEVVNRAVGRRESLAKDLRSAADLVARITIAQKLAGLNSTRVDWRDENLRHTPLSLALRARLIARRSSPGLLFSACGDELRLRQERKRHVVGPNQKTIMKKLVKDFGFTVKKARRLALSPPDWLRLASQEWVCEKMLPKPRRAYASKRGCPSKVFPEVSSRMVNYWRKHPHYWSTRHVIENIARSSLPDSADRFHQNVQTREERSRAHLSNF